MNNNMDKPNQSPHTTGLDLDAIMAEVAIKAAQEAPMSADELAEKQPWRNSVDVDPFAKTLESSDADRLAYREKQASKAATREKEKEAIEALTDAIKKMPNTLH